jgi:hypothetical protein
VHHPIEQARRLHSVLTSLDEEVEKGAVARQ